jgi:hypothetical protein
MKPIAIPLRPEKVESWKAFSRQLASARRAEFEDFNRRYGLTEHRAWLEKLPDGRHLVLVTHGGPGAKDFLEKLAQSDQPFDVWFREQISDAHGIDFARPLPIAMPELMIEAHP